MIKVLNKNGKFSISQIKKELQATEYERQQAKILAYDEASKWGPRIIYAICILLVIFGIWRAFTTPAQAAAPIDAWLTIPSSGGTNYRYFGTSGDNPANSNRTIKLALSFITGEDVLLCRIDTAIYPVNSPSDSVMLDVWTGDTPEAGGGWTDVFGITYPSQRIAGMTKAGSSINGGTWDFLADQGKCVYIEANRKYWIILGRTGGTEDINYWYAYENNNGPTWDYKSLFQAGWYDAPSRQLALTLAGTTSTEDYPAFQTSTDAYNPYVSEIFNSSVEELKTRVPLGYFYNTVNELDLFNNTSTNDATSTTYYFDMPTLGHFQFFSFSDLYNSDLLQSVRNYFWIIRLFLWAGFFFWTFWRLKNIEVL